MDISQVLSELDDLFVEQNQKNIEEFLAKHREEAKKEEDYGSLLILCNETIGFYRETGEYQKSIEMCHKALELASGMKLEGSIPYATTLLNAANAHRAAGLLQESLDLYMQVFPVYEKQLEPDNMYYANLYNNISLLYQEMQEYGKAKEELLKALKISSANQDTEFEIAVTHANLANTCMQLGEDNEAKEHALKAISMFEEQRIDDAHYSAALSALGSLYYKDGDYEKAVKTMEKSRDCVARYLGKNNIQYERLSDNISLIRKKLSTEPEEAGLKGLELCRRYYEEFGKPMIAEKFPEYVNRIAVGLVGKGSDCFGFDDEQSRDHDFGPRFVMWVTKETYEQIGEALQKAYEELPKTFLGTTRIETFHGRDRAGVMVIEDFYKSLTGINDISDIGVTKWLEAQEYELAAAVNGEVFCDEEGIFTKWRKKLLAYYPKEVWYRRIAQECALFSQNGQYNLPRMRKRGQLVAAELAKAECIRHAMKLAFLLERKYAPHDKWLFKGLQELEEGEGLLTDACNRVEQEGESVTRLIEKLSLLSVREEQEGEMALLIETLAVILAAALEKLGIVGHADAYLDANTEEILIKSDALINAGEERIDGLSLMIAKAEFEAFDKVQNEGGRASCQNNWPTFKVMRMSQYKTWDEEMLLQYLADFKINYSKGRNMIEEKYARMMASTAPDEYAKFADKLPTISDEKRAIMEEIIRLQVQWMEEFALEYPGLAENARLIHTSEDMPYDTSYETYLRGELGTYSDKMLELYGRYIVEHARRGTNVAREIMWNTVQFYGYKSFEEAVAKSH